MNLSRCLLGPLLLWASLRTTKGTQDSHHGALRQLQDFNLDAFTFDFAGVPINAEIAQTLCPEQWQATVSCIISDCPQFMDVCPDMELPAENMGTIPPTSDVQTEVLAEEVPEVPTCEELEEEYCNAFAPEGYEDCCIRDCAEAFMSLTACIILETTGEDRSDCALPECLTSTPTLSPTVPTTDPPSTSDGCYTNLDAIYFLISDDDKLFQQKRFVICPGTVMEIGFLVPGVGITQGQAPLVPRSNTEFLCGEDGRSENNCTIKGGDFGLIAVPVFFRQDLSINNVLVQGFTFEGQVQYAAFVATAGDISFVDCIVKDSANFAPFVFNYDSSLDLGRRMEEVADSDNHWDAALSYVEKSRDGSLSQRGLRDTNRELQGTFEGTIKDCLFVNNQQIERKLGVEFGIVSIKGPDHVIAFENCTFQDNQYANQELTPIGYAILVQGADVKLDGLCFVDNEFRGNGAVILEQTANPFQLDYLSGNYATEDENLDCTFAAWFESDEDRRNGVFTCVDVQTEECGGESLGSDPPPSPDDCPAPPEYTCADSAANLYGIYRANTTTSSPVQVTYSKVGLRVEFGAPPFDVCGNALPIAPRLVATGALEWRQRIEYGIDSCTQGGQVSLTQVAPGVGDQWEMVWVSGANTTIVELVLEQAECTEEEIQAENLPIYSPSDACDDASGNPYGLYTGIISDSDLSVTIEVEVEYTERGVIVTYPELACGNRLPITPTVRAAGAMEWDERIEYGMDVCTIGGAPTKVSLTLAPDGNWEFFWIAGDGGIAAGRLKVEVPARCVGTATSRSGKLP